MAFSQYMMAIASLILLESLGPSLAQKPCSEILFIPVTLSEGEITMPSTVGYFQIPAGSYTFDFSPSLDTTTGFDIVNCPSGTIDPGPESGTNFGPITTTESLFVKTFCETGLSCKFSISGTVALSSHDPHIKTFDGVAMTVHGEGDFLLAHSASVGFELQARFCKNSRGPWAPWTCAIAVRCASREPALEVSAAHFVVASHGPDDEVLAVESSAVLEHRSSSALRVLCDGASVTVKRARFHRMSYLNVQVRPRWGLADLKGLLGSNNNNKFDDIAHRNGEIFVPLEHKQHYIGAQHVPDLNRFHDSWRVVGSERMFSTPFPAPPVHMDLGGPMSSSLGTVTELLARNACKSAGVVDVEEMAMCMYDVVATSSLIHALNFTPSD